MSTVDRRVVEMGFDNKQFEEGVKSTLKSLENLNKGLEIKDQAGLDNLAGAINGISSKFDAMGIAVMTIFSRLANAAIDLGLKISKSLSIQPMMDGLSEYEQKMGAIQIILSNTASKGTTMADVSKTLNELNEYADKTVYNFGDMTTAIGKFTAAGNGLKESTQAIKGLSNIGADLGATPQAVSNVMTQFSQSLSSGKLMLQDWNSAMYAGMAGEKMWKGLTQAAYDLGQVTPEAFKRIMSGSTSFREAIKANAKGESDLVVSSKAMMLAFQRFADDPSMTESATKIKTFTQLIGTVKEEMGSGWAQSWEYIIGDLTQAKDLWTKVGNAINGVLGPMAEARNEMLKFWADNGGRTAIIEAIGNAFKFLGQVMKPIKEAWNEVFPPMTGKMLLDLSTKIRDLTRTFSLSDESAGKIKTTFHGLFSVINIVKNVIIDLVWGFGQILKALSPIGDALGKVVVALGGYLTSASKATDETNIIRLAFEYLAKGISWAAEGIVWAIQNISKAFQWLVSSFDWSWLSWLAKIPKAIAEAFKWMGGIVKQALSDMGFDNVLDVVNGGLLAAILIGVKKFMNSLTSMTDGGKGILGGIKSLLDGVRGALESWQQNIKANAILKIAIAIGILAAAILVLSTIDPVQMSVALGALTGLFVELFGSMAIFSKIVQSEGFRSMNKMTTSMIGLSTAILILSFAMKNLAGLSWEQIAKGLSAIAVLMTELVAVSIVLDKNKTKMTKGSVGLIALATALLIMTEAVKRLGQLSWEEMGKGLIGIGTLLAALAGFTKIVGGEKKMISIGLGLTALAAGILILSKSVKVFGDMDTESLIKGILGVGAVLTMLAGFTKIVGGEKKLISIGIGLVLVGSAVKILASAMRSFASMSWEEIGKGLVGMAGALLILIGAMYLIPKNILGTAVSLVIVSTALLILSHALQNMGGMSWEEIGKGLVVLAGSLLIIAGAMYLMSGALPGAAALLIISAALLTLSVVLIALGAMSWESIGKSLIMLAGVFVIFGVAALVLGPVVPVMLALGAALLLLGLGVAAAGLGILALGMGLVVLAEAFKANGTAIIHWITQLLGLIPIILQKLGEGIVAFVKAIGDGSEAIFIAVTKIILGILQTIIDTAPKFFQAVTVILVGIFQTIIDTAPKFFEAITVILLGICQLIIDTSPKIAEAAITLLSAFLLEFIRFIPKLVDAGLQMVVGILEGIARNLPDIIKAGVDIVVAWLRGMGKETPRIVDAAFKMIIDFINGLAKAIRENTDALYDAVGNLISAIIEAFAKAGGRFIDVGKNVISGIIEGLKKMGGALLDAGKDVVGGAVDGIKNFLGIKSPSRVFKGIGKNMGEGAIIGLHDMIKGVTHAGEDVGKGAVDGFSNALSTINTDNIENLNPTIRPVLDLSDVNAGIGQMDGALAADRSMSLGASVSNQNGSISHSDDLTEKMEASNSKIVSAIDSLKSDLNDLVTRVGKLQVVMDTGSLVGAIAPAIDGALGEMSVLNRRGVRP